jgi:mono/diheme cytochrome c family protein
MRLLSLAAIAVMQCCSLAASAQAQTAANQTTTPKPARQQAKPTASHATPENSGERKFRENCSRCHNAPEDLSPRITGTVLLHMRVRASLSEADEREILHYLAP